MKPTDEPLLVDPQEMADLEELCRLVSEGKRVTDPELHRRIAERAEAARAETARLLGVQNVAVDIVRAMRDAE